MLRSERGTAGRLLAFEHSPPPREVRASVQRFLKLSSTATRLWVIHVAAVFLSLAAQLALAADSFVRSYGALGESQAISSAAVDAGDNVIIGGAFSGPLFNLNDVQLTRIGDHDAFVTKLDIDGKIRWARNFGGAGGYAFGGSAAVDLRGDIVTVGQAGINLANPSIPIIGIEDGYIAKLDGRDGTVLWTNHIGGAGTAASLFRVAVDSSGNICTAGTFFNGALTQPQVPHDGNVDAVMVKFDGNTGAILWWKHLAAGLVSPAGIAVDASGNCYVAGTAFGDVIDPPLATAPATSRAFVLRLSGTTGKVDWAVQYEGQGRGSGAGAIAIDSSGNPFVGGSFQNGGITIHDLGSSDGFVIKLDGRTGTRLQETIIKGRSSAVGVGSLAFDPRGDVYVAGGVSGSGLSAPALSQTGYVDLFLLKLTAQGAVSWIRSFGGPNAQVSGQVTLSRSGNAIMAGWFQSASLSKPTISLKGTTDALLMKLARIELDSNGATAGITPRMPDAVAGEQVTLPPDNGSLLRSGYLFQGWNTKADGSGTSYRPGDVITAGQSNIMLFAQWSNTAATIPTLNPIGVLLLSLAIALAGGVARHRRPGCRS